MGEGRSSKMGNYDVTGRELDQVMNEHIDQAEHCRKSTSSVGRSCYSANRGFHRVVLSTTCTAV